MNLYWRDRVVSRLCRIAVRDLMCTLWVGEPVPAVLVRALEGIPSLLADAAHAAGERGEADTAGALCGLSQRAMVAYSAFAEEKDALLLLRDLDSSLADLLG